jgi:hypothetical protein
MKTTEHGETTALSKTCTVRMAAGHKYAEGFFLHPQSTDDSNSNTRSPTPTLYSSIDSDHRQQSSKSSQTSAGSGHILPPSNINHRSAYMPNIDILHIGAQFAHNFIEGYKHIDVADGQA